MIDIKGLGLKLPDFTLGPLNLHVPRGSFFALMGPTGSGKTLVLESVAGLVRPDKGSVAVGGRDVTGLPPERRKISLVYQDHSLFPHLTVMDNVTYGLRYHGINAREGKRAAMDLLETLGLSRLAKRKPGTLSGGEKQRTALARALACKPQVILLDEPLSSLDQQFREDLRGTLKELHTRMGVTFLMVTHDFVDALTLADRAAIIRLGKVEQCGEVSDIFRRPATPFAAGFVGMRNLFKAELDNGCIQFEGVRLDGFTGSGQGHLAVRPEDLLVCANSNHPQGWHTLKGTLESIHREGFSWIARVRCGQSVLAAVLGQGYALENTPAPGTAVTLACPTEALHFIPTP